ncbi:MULTISPECIES: MFS transporter [unclassified Neochlamydia]|uniref:MFS transporter n=1 Tax=unclassified Neochlamydia TaxID=2643326 RepID=UPI001BC928B5|nr:MULTISPECIES: MFS transporter [unclassified Neochlamydia]
MLTSLIRKYSSFTYLNVTQFLGALNDNIYKLLIVYFLIDQEGIENGHKILALTGAIFVLPFLLFSAFSGVLADRCSKRNIIAFTKILELMVMMLGILAFWYESRWGSYLILFLMAAQTALFGPSKYGILPELVPHDKISKSNGLMASFTFLAIISGTFFASFLVDITGRNFIVAAIFCTVIALVGVISSFCIEYTPPAGSLKKYDARFLYDIYSNLKLASLHPSLLMAVCGSAFFLFLGAFVQLNMIPFATQSLHLTDIQGGYLFLLTALGIGTGSVVAGKISGKMVELGLVPIAALGVAICCFMIDLFSHNLVMVMGLVILVGFFGGIYEIPLDSYVQVASPKKNRGQIVAATNFLSYIGVLCASIMLYLTEEMLKYSPDKSFSIIGTITLFITVLIGYQYFDYLARFIGMILSRLHFQVNYYGLENIPETPTIYVCSHTAWNDTLLMLGAQRRRLRFFIEQEQGHSSKFMRRLYRLLRVVFIPDIEPLERNTACLMAIKKTLDKGISVCIFVENEAIEEEIEKLNHSYSFRKILDETYYSIVPVIISKGMKDKKARWFVWLMEKFRVPASIAFNTKIPGEQPIPDDFEDELCLVTD